MKKYGIIAMNFNDFIKENEKSEKESYDFSYDWVLDTTDASEVKRYLEGKNLDSYCIEEYNADEDGEFINGSNYDSPENFLKNDQESTVKNEYGTFINYKVAVNLMDDDIREKLHSELSPCTDQEFFNAYAKAHEKKFGKAWEPAKRNPVY